MVAAPPAATRTAAATPGRDRVNACMPCMIKVSFRNGRAADCADYSPMLSSKCTLHTGCLERIPVILNPFCARRGRQQRAKDGPEHAFLPGAPGIILAPPHYPPLAGGGAQGREGRRDKPGDDAPIDSKPRTLS